MSYITFGSIPDELPLVESDNAPRGFKAETAYGYDPETGKRESPPITEYYLSFLCPTTAIFTSVYQALQAQSDAYFTDDLVNYISVSVTQDYNENLTDGSYDIMFILEGDWYTRIGDSWQVDLKGYGEPPTVAGIVPNQFFSVSESATNGTVIGTVEGFADTLIYQGRPDIPIAYDAATGTLSVSGNLDYETSDSYSLTIGDETVEVYVLDVSEAPVPERSTYTFFLDATAKPGTRVGTVTAETQGDSGIKPVYSIVSGNNSSFSIDSVSGEITLLNVDNVTNNQVLGVSYGQSYTPLTCTIKLVSPDTGITFEPYRFDLQANPAVNQVVGAITEPGVTLSLVDSVWGLSGSNLIVLKPEEIQPGIQTITIGVTNDKLQTGEITVFVDVAETTDTYGDQEFWIAEDSGNGTTVGTIEFNSDDPNITYAIAPTGLFEVNTKTGEIILVQASLLLVGSYTLTATATGDHSKSVKVVVYAVQAESDVSFTIAETAEVGSQVGTIPGAYPLTLDSGSYGNFAVNLANGVVTVGSLPISSVSFTMEDAETDSISVSIDVESEDGGSGDTGDAVIGNVYPGQSGQGLLSLEGIKFAVGSVAMGDGSLSLKYDNLDSATRNLGSSIVFNLPLALTYEASVNATATTAMITALRDIFAAGQAITVAVPGQDISMLMTALSQSYGGDNSSVSMTLMQVSS